MIVNQHPALIIDSTSHRYDIIFGDDFLDKCGITLNYDNKLIQWMEYTIPLCKASEFFSYNYYSSLITPLEIKSEQDFLSDAYDNTFATRILDAK